MFELKDDCDYNVRLCAGGLGGLGGTVWYDAVWYGKDRVEYFVTVDSEVSVGSRRRKRVGCVNKRGRVKLRAVQQEEARLEEGRCESKGKDTGVSVKGRANDRNKCTRASRLDVPLNAGLWCVARRQLERSEC